jgi:hypothetical protein
MNILYPVFALMLLTLGVAVRMGLARHRAVRRGEVDPAYYELYQGVEPREARLLSRHFSNLLETPLLFYVACIIAFVTGQDGMLPVSLAWAYVALRYLHSFVHLGSNIVLLRFRVFALSLLALALLLVVLLLGMT